MYYRISVACDTDCVSESASDSVTFFALGLLLRVSVTLRLEETNLLLSGTIHCGVQYRSCQRSFRAKSQSAFRDSGSIR
jgi:hypothetical protein